jgi:hypothetical protein
MRKKAMKKPAKPATRSSSRQLQSDADEVNAPVRVLKKHSEEKAKEETKGISDDSFKERTTVGRVLPRLRDMASFAKLPGASKTSRGAWMQSEETREPPPAESSKDPKSPNLPDSPEASQNFPDSPEETSQENPNPIQVKTDVETETDRHLQAALVSRWAARQRVRERR